MNSYLYTYNVFIYLSTDTESKSRSEKIYGVITLSNNILEVYVETNDNASGIGTYTIYTVEI